MIKFTFGLKISDAPGGFGTLFVLPAAVGLTDIPFEQQQRFHEALDVTWSDNPERESTRVLNGRHTCYAH